MYYEFKNIISLQISNPFKTMNKIKDVFIPLKRYFLFGFNKPLPFIYCPKPALIMIRCRDVGWKDKWDSPRYEEPPYIWIHLFRLNLIWWWKLDHYIDDYWEQALWYLYYYNTYSQGLLDKPDIYKARNGWPWENYVDNTSTWNNDFLKDEIR